MKLLLYNYVFASVLISAEVLTLIKDKSITCVLTDNSVNSTIYVINSDDLVKLERTIHEITTIYDDDWQWSKLSVNFRPVLDQRWTNFRPDTTGVRLENRFSLCFKQHSNILLHDRSYQHSTNIPLRHLHRPYSACQWRHYEIMNNLTHVSLVNSENNNVINVTKLEFYPVWLKFSPYNLNIKVHKYEFRYSTTTSTKPSYINITSMSCVSFYVSVDEGCYLDISVQPANSITKITGFNEKNKLKQWKKYEIRTDPKAINQTLSIDRGRDDNGNEGYWTIDGIYGCSSETVIYRANLNRSWTNQKCGELKQTNSSNELCDKASLGEKCKIKCLEVLGPKYPNCEEHRICLSENKCHCAWGFKGENCREECGEDSWGLDCLKNCTNCEKCDKKTGCQKCKAQYFGEQCVYKFPVVKKAPILEPSDDESIKILTNIEYGQDEEKAEHYYIQWRKLDSNDGFENYTDHQFPIAKNKESFSINISRNDSYQFRIILVSHNSSFQQDTIPKLTVYKKSLTAHVKHEETIVLNWIKHDPDETMYKITHRCQKSFCGHEAKEEYNMTSTTTIALTIKHSKICSIKLFIIKDGSDEFKEQTTVIPQNSTKEILPAELPGNVTFLKDQIVLELNKCHNFTGPLKYSIELICISEWCTNESTKIDPYHLLNYSTNITRDVKGLSPFTDYSIIVIAKRPGQHDKKQSYLTKSMPSAPQPVNTLHLYSSDEDTLFITWTEPFPPTGKIEAYNVTLRDHTSILVRTNCKMWPEFQCTNIPRGKKVSVYHVTVQAKNYEVAEWSESNFTINVENVTQAPQNLRIELSPQSTDEVILRWEYPLYTYGKIEKFRTVLHNSSGTENSTIPVFNEINYNKTIKIKYGIKYKFTAWAQNAHDGEKATIYFVISKPISKLSNQSFILWCKEKCHLVKPKLTTQENTSYNITIKQHNGTKTEHEAKESISPSEDKILCTENSPSCEIHSEFQDVANQSYFLQTDSEEIPIEFTATAESKIISKTNIIISAVVLSVILLFALLVGIFYYSCRYILKSKVSKATEMIEVKEKETLINTSNQTKIFFRPVDINEYAVYLFASLRDDTYQSVLTQQFQEVTTRKATDCIHGRLNKNLHKNHYKDILPYDDTRVILNDNENEDYINANYVDGYEHPKAYIVTQTPLTSTVHDFWSMICQENVKIIVMLCKLEEKECSKCQKYWPNDFSHFRFGSFLIECVSVTQNLNYIHRILEVKKNNKTHRVQHLQYLTWTIQGIPSCVKTFTAFVKELMGLRDEYPVVVHSEGGCGRTGMYILCDSVIRMSMKEKKVDFFQTLGKMRYQRDRVVSNVDQYIFCHFVLLEFYFPASNASNNFVLEIQQGMQETAIKRLVDRLDEAVTQPRNDKDKGFMISEDNSSSNNMSPLSVDCFNFPRRFIVTEEPSQNTLRSFWNLVLSHEVEIVVWLNGTNHNYKDYSRFWPKDTLHWFVNESTKLVFVCQDDSNDIYNTITVKIDTIGKSEEKFVKILYVKTWERTNATPSSTKDLIQIYDKIAPYNGQIVVTCYDGTTASGLFVVLVSLLEEINKHRSCDIFEAAYTAKQSCAEFLKNTEQIRFLYMAVLEYVREFNVYEVLS